MNLIELYVWFKFDKICVIVSLRSSLHFGMYIKTYGYPYRFCAMKHNLSPNFKNQYLVCFVYIAISAKSEVFKPYKVSKLYKLTAAL